MNSLRFLFFFTLISNCFSAFSQEDKTLEAVANYSLTLHYDTLNFENSHKENFILLLSKSCSIFKSKDKDIVDSLMEVNRRKTGLMQPVSNVRYTEEKIYLSYSNHLMYTTSPKIIGDLKVEREFPKIKWSIKNNIKNILGYRCQLASGNYHGRKFFVWFTNDLPFEAGPWKLIGLPGLIIKAEDITKRIRFELLSFKLINKSNVSVNLDLTEISWEKYMKLVRAMQDNPQSYLEQRLGRKISLNPPLKPLKRIPILPNYRYNYPLEAIEYYTQK